MGNCWMVSGAVMVLDIVATLGGAAIATFGGVGVVHANVGQKLLICYPFKSFLW